MVRILKKTNYKDFSHSLGVDRMHIKKNGHAPKNERAKFFHYMPKKGIFERKNIKV